MMITKWDSGENSEKEKTLKEARKIRNSATSNNGSIKSFSVSKLGVMEVRVEKFQISFADTAKATAVFDPNRVCVHFTFYCVECTHFAWSVHTYVDAWIICTAVQS